MALVDEGALSGDNAPVLPDTTPVAASAYSSVTVTAPVLTSIILIVYLLLHSASKLSYCVKLALILPTKL